MGSFVALRFLRYIGSVVWGLCSVDGQKKTRQSSSRARHNLVRPLFARVPPREKAWRTKNDPTDAFLYQHTGALRVRIASRIPLRQTVLSCAPAQNMGTASFSGPGAGRYPTANSVVNDLVRLGVGKVGSPFPFDKVRSDQSRHACVHPK